MKRGISRFALVAYAAYWSVSGLASTDTNANVESQGSKESIHEIPLQGSMSEIDEHVNDWTNTPYSHADLKTCVDLIEQITSVEQVVDVHTIESHHDLAVVGGRAAWVLERRLCEELPAVTSTNDPDELTKIKTAAYLLLANREKELIAQRAQKQVERMNADQKMGTALSGDSHEALLRVLAKEPNVKVRRAVASNRNTPLSTLSDMRINDADDVVRTLATENMKNARTILDVIRARPPWDDTNTVKSLE